MAESSIQDSLVSLGWYRCHPRENLWKHCSSFAEMSWQDAAAMEMRKYALLRQNAKTNNPACTDQKRVQGSDAVPLGERQQR